MLASVGLSRACVEDPELRISVESVRALLEQSARASELHAFGLLMAEGRRLSNLGALGLLSREEPNLRLALASLARYSKVHNEALIQHFEEAQGVVTLQVELLLETTEPTRQAYELLVAVVLKLVKVFLGADWRARRICFAHSPPRDLGVHRRVLGQTPEFGCDFNGVVCSTADLETPIASADPVMAAYIRQRFVPDAPVGAEVTHEVRQMVLLLLPKGRCTVDQVAQFMGVNRRTLHRQLAKEQTTFSNVVQGVKAELAARYVHDRSRQLTEVSQLLGFADLSSFSRWHRSTFGLSAEQTRLSEQH
jgi:AraC-like DNA-binding protein